MTVAELIERLRELPQDMPVVVFVFAGSYVQQDICVVPFTLRHGTGREHEKECEVCLKDFEQRGI